MQTHTHVQLIPEPQIICTARVHGMIGRGKRSVPICDCRGILGSYQEWIGRSTSRTSTSRPNLISAVLVHPGSASHPHGRLPWCRTLRTDQIASFYTLSKKLCPHSLLNASGFLHEKDRGRSVLDGRRYDKGGRGVQCWPSGSHRGNHKGSRSIVQVRAVVRKRTDGPGDRVGAGGFGRVP